MIYKDGDFYVDRKKNKGEGNTPVKNAKQFHLAEEIDYIRGRAADRDACVLAIGPLMSFASANGDAWLLDPEDRLAIRVAHDGLPEEFDFDESESNFEIGWTGEYRIEGDTFVFTDHGTGGEITVAGYLPERLAQELE